MAISKMSNGFYTFSDSYLKSMRKQDLINYIRTIEKNWQNSLITNGIQYENCKRLLAEEQCKAIDEFTHQLKENLNQEFPSNYESTRPYFSLENARLIVDDVAEQMKAGGIE